MLLLAFGAGWLISTGFWRRGAKKPAVSAPAAAKPAVAADAGPRRVHLLEPCDNRIGPGAPVKPPCESIGHHASPVTFSWEPLVEGAEYEFLLGKTVCSSPVYIAGAVHREKTSATTLTVPLAQTPADEMYSLHIYARKEGWELGRLWMGGDWNYNFRVAGPDGRFTPDSVCYDKHYRWHEKDQARRESHYETPKPLHTEVLPPPPAGSAPAVSSDWQAGATPPLFAAIGRSDEEALRQALSNGADPSAPWKGKLPLHEALDNFHGRRSIPLLLLEKGAPMDLLAAASVGSDEQLKTLIASGADLNARTPMKKSALHLAVHYGRPGAIQLLLTAGADLNPLDFANKTPLAWSMQGDPATALPLIEGGADVNHLDRLHQSPLYYAASYGNTQLAVLLIAKGAKVNEPGQQGFTALHMAAQYGRMDMVRLLVENGADVNARDIHGETALDRMRNRGEKNVAEIEGYLRGRGAK